MTSFSIQTATLQGTRLTTVLTDPTRELSHPRVSADGTKITFTRYNHFVNGLATENGDYTDTEICLMNSDGTGLISVTNHAPGVVCANSSFTPGDTGLVFLTNATGALQFAVFTFSPPTLTYLPTPSGLLVTDPHWVGNLVIFAQTRVNEQNSIWIMNADGTGLRRLTAPALPVPPDPSFAIGDYDPRLSPDGRRFVTFRHMGGTDFRIIQRKVDLSYPEMDLSGPTNLDAVPDWSGDGKLLIFRAFTPDHTRQEIWTMNYYGRLRTKVSLPATYNYNHPNFFPGDGSGLAARFAVSAQLVG